VAAQRHRGRRLPDRGYDVVDPSIIDWAAARPDCNVILRRLIPLTGIRHFLRVREA
jgi:hypothetical protein